MAGGVAEARDLLGLRQQVRYPIEDKIDKRVAPWSDGCGHVTKDNRDRRLVGLRPQLSDHGR
jgi:hypothetical protein